MDEADALARGRELRELILGSEWTRDDPSAGDPVGEFVASTVRNVWGGLWARPGLDLRTRSACTITLMTSLGRVEELALHVRGALRNNLLTELEIQEIILHVAGYCGYPASQSGIKTFKTTLEQLRSEAAGADGEAP